MYKDYSCKRTEEYNILNVIKSTRRHCLHKINVFNFLVGSNSDKISAKKKKVGAVCEYEK